MSIWSPKPKRGMNPVQILRNEAWQKGAFRFFTADIARMNGADVVVPRHPLGQSPLCSPAARRVREA